METRTRLLETAELVFTERGFRATSVEDIAEEAGYSKGAIYSNFENKDELFLAVLERRVDARILGVESSIASDAPIAVQAKQAGDAWLDVFRNSQWSLLLMEFAIHAARRPELRDRFAERNRSMRSAIPSAIERRLATLELVAPVPVEDLATIFFALGSGFIFEKLIDPKGVPDSLFGDALALLLGGLTSGDGAKPMTPSSTGSRRPPPPSAGKWRPTAAGRTTGPGAAT